MSRRFLLPFLVLVWAVPSFAQDLSQFTKLLLPAYTSQTISGAGGSTFTTILRGYTEVETRYYPALESSEGGPRPAIATQAPFNPLFVALDYGPPAATGRFLFVETARLGDLSLQYFVASFDPLGLAKNQYTAMPIVRDPRTSASRILGVPIEPAIDYSDPVIGIMTGYARRNTLRVYDFGGSGSSEVDVEVFYEGLFGRTGSLGTKRLRLDRRGGDDATFPYFGELSLDQCLPISRRTPCAVFGMRVEVRPVTEGLRYWPMASSTDNKTHHVTLFVPGSL